MSEPEPRRQRKRLRIATSISKPLTKEQFAQPHTCSQTHSYISWYPLLFGLFLNPIQLHPLLQEDKIKVNKSCIRQIKLPLHHIREPDNPNHTAIMSADAEPQVGTHTYILNIVMSCGGCSGAINRKLSKMEGWFPSFPRSHPPPRLRPPNP